MISDHSDKPLVDLEYLKMLIGSADFRGNGFLKDMRDTFREEAQKFKIAFEDSRAKADLDGLCKITHKLAGGAASLGFVKLAAHTKDIENTIRVGEIVDFDQAESTLMPLINETCETFENLIGV